MNGASLSFEQDNQEKLNKYKKSPPHPSYIAGFIDGDGCIFIRKIIDGYQSGFVLTQCRTNILQIIRYHFGGSITSSVNRNNKIINIMDNNNDYYHKYNIRNQYNLTIRSNEYQVLLQYLYNSFIIKQQQFECLYNFNKLTNLSNKVEEKEELYSICVNCNKTCEIDINNLLRLNIEYISGLFDAEGCIFIDKKLTDVCISIAQKNHPLILYEIQKYVGIGAVYQYKYEIFKKSDCLKFIQLIKPFTIVKLNQILAFETFLQTDDIIVKEQMYRICNEEKHKIENFSELNHNENGKDGYQKMIQLKELKKKVCEQILMKEVYKQKSENMMGENNHNFGKKFSEEHKKKMSDSIRDAKNGVSDDIIIKVRQMIQEGYKNIEIQKLLELPRHTLTRIKTGIIVCRNEEKQERHTSKKEDINISKRKIQPDEIIFVILKYIENWKPMQILDYLHEERIKKNIPNTITIDIIKNIKRNIKNNKNVLYDCEVTPEKYNYYIKLINKYKEII